MLFTKTLIYINNARLLTYILIDDLLSIIKFKYNNNYVPESIDQLSEILIIKIMASHYNTSIKA
jgi:hypothetical protein